MPANEKSSVHLEVRAEGIASQGCSSDQCGAVQELRSGHTPGPWRLNERDCAVSIPVGVSGCHNAYAYAGTLANARLIAAAPEMYAALLEAREMLREEGWVVLSQISGAIRKAEGRTPEATTSEPAAPSPLPKMSPNSEVS